MRVLICGDRNYKKKGLIKRHILQLKPEVIIEGGCRGADRLARDIAEEYDISFIEVKADWDKHGKSAGPIRNREMLKYKPDLVLAFHDDIENSKGTKNMINIARQEGIKVIIAL